MRVALRKALAPIVDGNARKALKRLEFGFRKRLRMLAPHLDAIALHRLFKDLGVGPGQLVMAHASLSLVPTTLSADAILDILQDIVGAHGTIVVPTFPRVNSTTFLNSDSPFDARITPSGMGALSEALRHRPGAVRSTHPTKSVAAIGAEAASICAGHERCLYPFGMGSPYHKMHELGVRIVGIGAPMSYLSFVHFPEDLDHRRVNRPVWENIVYQKLCIDLSGREHLVRTMTHNMALMPDADPEKFCRKHLNRSHYVIKRASLSDFFAVDGRALVAAIRDGWAKGVTIYD